MTKSELFTAAHKLAKTFEGNYKACFVLALNELRNVNPIDRVYDMVELNNTYTIGGRKGMNVRNQDTWKIVNKEAFNQLYKELKGTFAAKVMMTIAKKQNGVATSRQLDIIIDAA